MENVIYIIFAFIVIPLTMVIGFLEKKSRRVLSFVVIGITTCLIASEVNTLIMSAGDFSYFYYTTTISPIVEEILKALPVIYMVFFYWHYQKIEKCITIGLAVGVGFAMFENIVIFFQNDSDETLLWAISRGLGAGLMHALCTGLIAVGAYFVSKQKKGAVFLMIGVLSVAMIYHGAYNCMVQTEKIKYLGLLLPVITYAVFLPLYRNTKGTIQSKFENKK